MNITIIAYIVYLTFTLSIVFIVGHKLYHNGKVFLYDIFDGDQDLLHAVNNLLLIGFYLINIGFVVQSIDGIHYVKTWERLIPRIGNMIGYNLILLGMIHFVNLWTLYKMRKRAMHDKKRKEIIKAHA